MTALARGFLRHEFASGVTRTFNQCEFWQVARGFMREEVGAAFSDKVKTLQHYT